MPRGGGRQDGDPVGIPPDVVENLRRSGEGSLGIDNPLGITHRRQVTPERRGLMQVAMCGEEPQLVSGERFLQIVQKPSTEHP